MIRTEWYGHKQYIDKQSDTDKTRIDGHVTFLDNNKKYIDKASALSMYVGFSLSAFLNLLTYETYILAIMIQLVSKV